MAVGTDRSFPSAAEAITVDARAKGAAISVLLVEVNCKSAPGKGLIAFGT